MRSGRVPTTLIRYIPSGLVASTVISPLAGLIEIKSNGLFKVKPVLKSTPEYVKVFVKPPSQLIFAKY
jgi:hypothetical protein